MSLPQVWYHGPNIGQRNQISGICGWSGDRELEGDGVRHVWYYGRKIAKALLLETSIDFGCILNVSYYKSINLMMTYHDEVSQLWKWTCLNAESRPAFITWSSQQRPWRRKEPPGAPCQYTPFLFWHGGLLKFRARLPRTGVRSMRLQIPNSVKTSREHSDIFNSCFVREHNFHSGYVLLEEISKQYISWASTPSWFQITKMAHFTASCDVTLYVTLTRCLMNNEKWRKASELSSYIRERYWVLLRHK